MFFTPAPPEKAAVKVAVPFPWFVMPGPEKVPDGAWLPVSVMAGVLLQILAGSPLKLTVGVVLTVIEITFEIAGLPVKHADVLLEVITTLIKSPFTNEDEV